MCAANDCGASRDDTLSALSAGARRLQLDVVLGSDLLDQVELGLDEIHALLFFVHDFFEQLTRDVVFHRSAVRYRGAKIDQRLELQLEVAFKRFFDVLADQQLVEILKIRQALEKQNSLDHP